MNPSESRQWTESRQWAERSKWLKRNQKVTPQPLKPVERRPSLASNTSSTSQSDSMDIPGMGQQRRMSESSMASSQGSSMGTSPTTELKNMMSGMKNASSGQQQMNPLQPPRGSRFSNSDMHMSF
ncbi:hypothetical protein A1Q2_00447 [Trichosporon asahii var. asahii CBS 8904]|uniref:Uncharacterized protein n=1 Tax=Trichosporon asahii var. asahii (strain CBS 8904) TaxID=1220162 RepID=K1W091_TRIAC|nr:hypothetical protein A1Q2_00447 [Trichosporon asahii var. asahii CBS 8904]